MKFILICCLFAFPQMMYAQEHSLTVDVTQSSMAVPTLIYNKYYGSHAGVEKFYQIGLGYHLQLQNTYSNPVRASIIDLKDYILIHAVSGPSLRIGHFYGLKKKHSIAYYGFGAYLKYLYNSNMEYEVYDDYFDTESNKEFFKQYDRIGCFYPFFNIGKIHEYKGFMSDMYTGIQFNMKYRVRHVTSEVHKSFNNITTVIPPYTKKTFSIFPTIVLGIRLGLYR